MSSDVQLLVFDPARGAIVHARWLGGSATREKAREVLGPHPRQVRTGLDCWTGVLPAAAEQLAHESHAGGATPEEVVALARRFPVPPYVWLIDHDY